MNRRRMMMQSLLNSPVHTELEITEANALLAKIGSRYFTKVNEGLAICCLITRYESGTYYYEPFLVSELKEAVTFETTGSAPGVYASSTSVIYNDKTYYLSAWRVAIATQFPMSENPFNLPFLNDITGVEYTSTTSGQRESAIDLLDYYYKVRWQ